MGPTCYGRQAVSQNELAPIGAGVSSAASVPMQAMQLQANMNLANAQAVQSASQTALNKAQAEKALADAGYTRQSAREAKVSSDIAEANASRRTSGWGRFVEGTGDFFGSIGNLMRGAFKVGGGGR